MHLTYPFQGRVQLGGLQLGAALGLGGGPARGQGLPRQLAHQFLGPLGHVIFVQAQSLEVGEHIWRCARRHPGAAVTWETGPLVSALRRKTLKPASTSLGVRRLQERLE